MRLIERLQRFQRDEDAATAVEYSIMLALILLVVITAIGNFGIAQNTMWGKVDTQMKAHGVN